MQESYHLRNQTTSSTVFSLCLGRIHRAQCTPQVPTDHFSYIPTRTQTLIFCSCACVYFGYWPQSSIIRLQCKHTLASAGWIALRSCPCDHIQILVSHQHSRWFVFDLVQIMPTGRTIVTGTSHRWPCMCVCVCVREGPRRDLSLKELSWTLIISLPMFGEIDQILTTDSTASSQDKISVFYPFALTMAGRFMVNKQINFFLRITNSHGYFAKCIICIAATAFQLLIWIHNNEFHKEWPGYRFTWIFGIRTYPIRFYPFPCQT